MNIGKFYVRNSHYNDFQAIHRLLSLKSSKFLGPTKRKIFDPESFFEIYCTHSILVKEKEENENIIGYAEIKNFPKIEPLPKDTWMEWLEHHYCINLPILHSNTLFLNYLIYDLNHCPELLLTVLRETFFREPYVRFILVVMPPYRPMRFKEDEPDFTIIEPYGTLFYPKDFSVQKCSNPQKIFVIERNDIIPEMRFRRALPEDNDELVEIINQDRPQIKKQLGDFYIAEELLSETPHKSLIVAEILNETVGFIWLNSSLNIITLIKNFELEAYGNLLKLNPNARTRMLVRNVTIFSHFTLPIAEGGSSGSSGRSRGSDSTTSSSSVENDTKFIKREVVFKKFRVLEDRLGKTDWYVDTFERIFRIRYNVTAAGGLDMTASLNAFAMQLYGLHVSNDPRKLFLFLVAAFSAHPDRDYCIFSMPVNWEFTKGLRLLLHFFINVIPRPGCILNDALYLTHRACFIGDISIHNVRKEDVEQLEKLLLHDNEQQQKDNLEGTQKDQFMDMPNTDSKFDVGDASKHPFPSKHRFPSNYDVSGSKMSQTVGSKHHLATTSSHHSGKTSFKTSQYSLKTSQQSMRSEHSKILKHRRLRYYAHSAKCSKHSLRTLEELEEIENEEKQHQHESKVLHEILEEIFSNPFSDYRCLIIRIGNSKIPPGFNTIIGFAIVRQFHQVHLLRNHFIIPECDEVRSFCRGELVMLKLNPLFRFKTDLIFREIARYADYWDFYYFYPIKHKVTPLSNDLLTKMQPIEPRRNKRTFFQDPDMIGFKPRRSIPSLPELNLSEDYFAIYQHNLRPTQFFGSHEPIVIIGYNDYTRAYLRLSIFSFNNKNTSNTNMYCCVPKLNITVISQPGIVEADQDNQFFCDYCENQNLCWINWLNSDEFIRDIDYRMDLSKYIKFINGNVKSINRQKQLVNLDNNCEIFYDRLLILSSIFFGPPKEIKISDAELPPNYQHINNRYHKIIVYHKLQALLEELPKDVAPKIMVYGCRVRAFEFINFLIKHNIKGENITLLMPPDTFKEYEVYLNNPFIDRKIEIILQEMVEDLKVQVHEHVKISHWNTYRESPNIESVTFRKREHNEDIQMTLDCDIFISFSESKSYTTMTEVFKASHLEMHGQNLIVDEFYRTSDPRILAFGRNTKNIDSFNYQRRYTNPREVGEKLVAVVEAPVGSKSIPIDPKFYLPNSCKSQLPFDYYMIKICTPKLYLANHLSNQYKINLTTYSNGEFCRVRLNEHMIVEEILCITQRVINLDFLTFFCGKHEKLLNNLHLRWISHRFDNFLDFFQEPWTELIMHDHFEELRQINRELIIETMDDILRYKRDLDRQTRRAIAYRRLADMSIPSEMEDQLFSFLRKYRREFYFSFALPEDFTQ